MGVERIVQPHRPFHSTITQGETSYSVWSVSQETKLLSEIYQDGGIEKRKRETKQLE